uniref:Uncharacterized protein n=1 Tax=Parastrongyloides trichosuri TaxID=131310 RepID=A0A0N4ZML9_PARTI
MLSDNIFKQKEDFENKLNDLTESKAFLRGEFESLNEKFVSVLNENNEYCEKIKELQKENDELKEREDLMKMELGSIKLQLSTKNHRHLFDKINDDPELKKYFNNQQMLLEHLETENDSMHEMYHLMFEKLRHQLKNVNNQTTDDMDEFKNEDYPHIEMETTEKVGSLQSISSSPTTGSRGIIEIV